ncbi:MAG: hypothetical protein V8Q84_04830 [Bilophila sp.]
MWRQRCSPRWASCGNATILEPSAGKGDLADAAVEKLDCYYNRCRERVHCIEIEPELQAAIRAKAIRWSARTS